MEPSDERCRAWERFRAIDAAFRAGDLAALAVAVGDPSAIPNGMLEQGIGSPLEYAIYHSPLPFVRTLLELGAEPNPREPTAFPPLLAALTCAWPRPGSRVRPDVPELLRLLLAHGADPDQRGVNDFTPLHLAAAHGDLAAVRLLLAQGADPRLRTRVDEYETPRELAARAGFAEIARVLLEAETRGAG